MKTIRFTDDTKKEEGFRIIILNGLVEYTGRKTYRVPSFILDLLDKEQVPYEIVEDNHHDVLQTRDTSGA